MMIKLALIHSIYIIYVLNYFKTRYNFAHPITYFNNKLLYHPIECRKYPDLRFVNWKYTFLVFSFIYII